ncbi:MAG: DUF885 domain-containing protein [Gammaproteobacteria bacterium]|jgi:uncharacterized protein (DUF885 family)|nr:DUF885 domain-containing protein [Gammaproteobacteria bacterium]
MSESETPAARLEGILNTYYDAWFRFHPESAVELGVPGHDGQLAPYDDDDFGALMTLNEELINSIDELDQSKLDPDLALDCRLAYGAAFLEMDDLLRNDWRMRDPAAFLPINAIYQLTIRELEDFPEALCSRLRAIPAYLRGARRFLQIAPAEVPRLWVESAITEAREGERFLGGLVENPRVRREARRLRNLPQWVNPAIEAVRAYGDFLEQVVLAKAQGDFACGEERFASLLRWRHGLDIGVDELHRYGSVLFEETRAELAAVCIEISGSDDVDALLRKIQADHPAAHELLAAYRLQMQAARKFLETHDLVTLPESENLLVVDTPGFLRHEIPFAAYVEPARNDARQRGYYYVSPADSEELLAEHNHSSIPHTCVHEAWPGHHLQFVTANGSPVASSLPRVLNASATLYEGWALYCETLMQEQGFLERPESRFILLKDRLWRAMRVMLDVELHTRGLGLDAAEERMCRYLGFAPAQARADLTWYTQAPTVPMGYATGFALIRELRAARQQADPDFSLRGFHDQLLGVGSVGLPMVIERAFGKETWQGVRARLLERAG